VCNHGPDPLWENPLSCSSASNPDPNCVFFSFDGVDGVGKSTQMQLFCEWLRDAGRDVLSCRDPGSTRLGEAIRGLLLDRGDAPMHRRSEMLLYMAARTQMVEEVIRPAISAGRTVVSDRFLLANIVYQGYAGGLDLNTIRRVGEVATDGIRPDLTFLLDMPAHAAGKRIRRELDRMESQGLDFLERVRQGFLAEAALHPDRIVVISAERDVDSVQQAIRDAACRFSRRTSEENRSMP
jgi:dTMP kinase